MNTLEFNRLSDEIKKLLIGIDERETDVDDGWWETCAGADFGARKLRELLDLLRDRCVTEESVSAALPHRALPELSQSSRLITDQHARIADWVAMRTGCDAHTWAGYVCFGLERDGELRVGVVFEGFTGTSANIHVAAVNAHAFTREFFEVVFGYAFNQLKLKRLTGLVAANNERALQFDRHLGFENEAVLKDGCEDGDVIVLVMRPENCRFLRRIEDGR